VSRFNGFNPRLRRRKTNARSIIDSPGESIAGRKQKPDANDPQAAREVTNRRININLGMRTAGAPGVGFQKSRECIFQVKC
jgi:hypothetical protein